MNFCSKVLKKDDMLLIHLINHEILSSLISYISGVQSSLPDFYEKFKNKLRTEEQGADTMVWLAISPSVKKVASGLFFQGRWKFHFTELRFVKYVQLN